MTAVGVWTASESSADLLSDTRVVRDVSDRMFMLDSDAAPLAKLLMAPGAKKGAAEATKIEWLTSGLLPRLTTSTENMDTTETGQDVATGTGVYFKPGDLVKNVINGEVMFVSSIATDTLTVIRGVGTATFGTSGTAGNSGDILMRIGNAAAEGATLGAIRNVKYVAQYNLCQTIRTASGFSRRATQQKLYGPQEPVAEKKRKGVEHLVEVNNTAFWGARQAPLSGTTTMAGGLIYYIASNITAINGALTEANFNAWLRDVGRYGSDKKILFVSPVIFAAINGFVRGKLAINDSGAGIKQYGVAISTYTTPQGKTFGLVPCPEWDDYTATATSYSPGSTAFAVDMDQVSFKYLQTTQYLQGREANDEDAVKFEFLTDFSLEIGNEETHGLLTGVTS